MANKTINQIDNTVTSVAGGDYLPIWDTSAGKTGKITRENLVSGLQSSLTFDNYPTKNSSNPAKSGGIFLANAVIMASSKTITSAPTIESGSIIRVMFTSAITGSDTTTALSLSYNGTSYPVKVGKQGSLSNFVASNVNNTYTYLQAYTTLELAFDGSQFIIIGNPVVLSSSDYTIYADGSIVNRPQAKVIHLTVRDFSITPSINYIALSEIEASLTNDYILVGLRGLWEDNNVDKYLRGAESLSNYPEDSGFFQAFISPADTSDDWTNKAITLDFDAYLIRKSTMKEMTV